MRSLASSSSSYSRACGKFASPLRSAPRSSSVTSHRREVIQTLGLLSLPLSLLSTSGAYAEEISSIDETGSKQGTKAGSKVFFDVTLEGQDIGRIVVETFDVAPVGSLRFKDLAIGKNGVGYRRSRFDGIFDTHLRVEGAASLSYSATGESFIAGGDSIADLQAEMTAPARKLHDSSGLVSLMVEEEKERPITERLVARDGKLVTVQYQAGEAPNATGFMITRSPAPQLDRTNLVIGRVIEGMDIVEQIAALPYSKPREDWYDGPFFAAGKAIGDKRAAVAEKGFNRPFKRVLIKKCGVL
jgi:peptidyl-prolyl cis-trans isomerase B (cyclophilin B)